MVKADVQLDAKGLACPMPVVKTKLKMNEMKEGQVLEVQATDKGSIADLSAWAKTVGHQYLGIVEKDDVLYHYIRKCSDDTCDDITFEPTITHEELQKRDGLVLDVREEAEFAFGHIEGAKSIPFGELENV